MQSGLPSVSCNSYDLQCLNVQAVRSTEPSSPDASITTPHVQVETMPDAGQPEEVPRSPKRQRTSHKSTDPFRPLGGVSASVR